MPRHLHLIYDHSPTSGSGHKLRIHQFYHQLNSYISFSFDDVTFHEVSSSNFSTNDLNLSLDTSNYIIIDSFFLPDSFIFSVSSLVDKILIVDDWIGRSISSISNLGIIDWTPLAHLTPLNHSNPNNFLGPQFAPIQPVLELPEKQSIATVYLGSAFSYSQKFLLDLLSNLFNFVDKVVFIGGTFNPHYISDSRVLCFQSLDHSSLLRYLRLSRYTVCSGGWFAFEALSCNCHLLLGQVESTTYFDASGFVYMGLGSPFFSLHHDKQSALFLPLPCESPPNLRSAHYLIGSQFKTVVDFLFAS